MNSPMSIANGASTRVVDHDTVTSGTLSSSPPLPGSIGSGGASPLQRFVRAKAKINSVYEEIHNYVGEVNRFLNAMASGGGGGETTAGDSLATAAAVGGGKGAAAAAVSVDSLVVDEEAVQKAAGYAQQVDGIRTVLSRDHMKVVFFGRTSNGKSTCINALLGDRILPTGIGHTTSCFLQVEGGEEGEEEPFIVISEEDCSQSSNQDDLDASKRRSVQSISQLGNALSSEKLEASAKVRIVWPKEKCKMLGEEVVIIDSPGIDVETDLDAWIDRVCLDSDVFVLVANSESTIMLTEKRFFHKVSERLSKPNIFVVHNRSDAFAGEEMVAEVRGQHTERAIKFLVDELRVCCNRQEAEDRIFFISAKEALAARLQEAQGLPPQISTEDFFPRYLEFQNFEKRFTDCLSRAAVSTKFAQHSRRGAQIIFDIAAAMANVNARALNQQRANQELKKEIWDKRDFILKQLELMTLDVKNKIHSITEDVEYKVGKAMSEEIRRLSVLVDEFNDPFHPDPLVLNVYKSRLNHHIEAGIGSNLKSRLSSDLQFNIEAHEQEMIDRMTALLPADKQQISRNILPRRDSFEVLYHLHFDNLCADFQEDIRFRFSLGFNALFHRFLTGKRSTGKRPLSAGPTGGGGSGDFPSPTSRHTDMHHEFSPNNLVVGDDWSLVSKVAVAALTSQGTMGGLLVGGLLIKTVGWRAILGCSAIYGGVYLYERLTWTNNAKCSEFKRQYVEHAARKLRLVIDMTSANCSHQVQQELSSTFARLCRLVDETTTDMQDGIDKIDGTLAKLEEGAGRSKVLKNQANFIANKLELFDRTYLSAED